MLLENKARKEPFLSRFLFQASPGQFRNGPASIDKALPSSISILLPGWGSAGSAGEAGAASLLKSESQGLGFSFPRWTLKMQRNVISICFKSRGGRNNGTPL